MAAKRGPVLAYVRVSPDCMRKIAEGKSVSGLLRPVKRGEAKGIAGAVFEPIPESEDRK